MDYCTDPLIRVTTPNSTRSDFSHDGKMRRRVRVEYTWVGGAYTKVWELFKKETRNRNPFYLVGFGFGLMGRLPIY